MKIALCLFGLPRGNKFTWNSILKKILEPSKSDLFIHTWMLEKSIENWHGSIEPDNKQAIEYQKFILKNSRALVSWKIEKQFEIIPKNFIYQESTIYYSNQCHMWESIRAAKELALKREELDGEKYEYFIFTRPDLYFMEALEPNFFLSGKNLLHSGIKQSNQINGEDLFFIVSRDSVSIIDEILRRTIAKQYVHNCIYNPLIHEFSCKGKNIDNSNIISSQNMLIIRPTNIKDVAKKIIRKFKYLIIK